MKRWIFIVIILGKWRRWAGMQGIVVGILVRIRICVG
jgi:hypothetical protein